MSFDLLGPVIVMEVIVLAVFFGGMFWIHRVEQRESAAPTRMKPVPDSQHDPIRDAGAEDERSTRRAAA